MLLYFTELPYRIASNRNWRKIYVEYHRQCYFVINIKTPTRNNGRLVEKFDVLLEETIRYCLFHASIDFVRLPFNDRIYILLRSTL